MTTPADKGMLLDNLIWSDIEYPLHSFVERFMLPQIVKVQEGYYGPTEDSCIGAEQMLTLHCVKSTEKVLARDRKKKELNIPLNCSQKVELRHANFRGVYETVEEISRLPTKFVRITQGYFGADDGSASLNPGDKLEVIRVEHGLGGTENHILFLNEERCPVRLPFSVSAGFQSLLDGREYYLKELVASCVKLPVFFQFIDPPSLTRRPSENVFNSSLGVLELEKVYKDETIICTTKEGKARTVVSCPKHLPITINVARGALSDDKDYIRVCRTFHEGVSLKKIESMEIENIYASRDTIREYEYIEVLPPTLPPRASMYDGSPVPSPPAVKKNSSAQKDIQDDDADSHDYLEIDDYVSGIPPKVDRERKGNGSLPSASTPSIQRGGSVDSHASNSFPDSDDDDIYIGLDDYEFPDPPPEYTPNTEPSKDPVPPPRKKAGTKPPPVRPKPKPKPKPASAQPSQQKENGGFTKPDQLSQVTFDEMSKSGIPQPSSIQKEDRDISISKNLSQVTISEVQKPESVQPPSKQKENKDFTKPDQLSQMAVNEVPKPGSAQLPSKQKEDDEHFIVPEDLSQMTVNEVSKFLTYFNLSNFVEGFAAHCIDGSLLVDLTEEELKSIGMSAIQCRIVRRLVGGWRPKQ